jgi:hypothetical protein
MDSTFQEIWPSQATLEHNGDPGAVDIEFIISGSILNG